MLILFRSQRGKCKLVRSASRLPKNNAADNCSIENRSLGRGINWTQRAINEIAKIRAFCEALKSPAVRAAPPSISSAQRKKKKAQACLTRALCKSWNYDEQELRAKITTKFMTWWGKRAKNTWRWGWGGEMTTRREGWTDKEGGTDR